MLMLIKIKKYLFLAFALSVICLLFLVRTSFADSYVLTASVPYEVPTQASVIDTLGVTTSDPSVAITGTCGVITPSAVVSLWNAGSLLGATTCQNDGTFTVIIHLQAGLNSVVAKTSNIANVYGPASLPVLFTYNPPPVAQPEQPKTEAPSTSSSVSENPVQPASALQVSSPQPFGVLTNNGAVSVDITVQGGDTPYDIVIKWGDGKTDNKTVTEPGTYTFSHVYKQKSSYTATVKVKDNKGNTSDIFIPFSDVKGAITKKVISEPPAPIVNGSTVTLSVIAISVLLMVTAVTTFLLGHAHRIHIHNRAVAAKKRRKKTAPKPARR